MHVVFRQNLGITDAKKYGLDHKECQIGMEADVKDELAAKALLDSGMAVDAKKADTDQLIVSFREEQAKQEGRILQLQALLRDATVGEAPMRDGTAGPGMVVQVRFDADEDVEEFLIGSREESATTNLEVYSAASPLGRALTGAREGATVSYDTPTGKTMQVTLLSARPFTG